ncbi:MAG: hypothetical protein QM767_11325 [Anaeromyxobacter sp.]
MLVVFRPPGLGGTMFGPLLRELERLKGGMTLTFPLLADERGYLDKECPGDSCKYQFKVLEEDWVAKFQDEAVYCPMCGRSAPSDQWLTTEQVEEAQRQAVAHLEAKIGRALDAGASEFNARQPRSGFVRFSMRTTGARPAPVIVPLAAADILEQLLTCEKCGARYGVLGAAFFCPCCGHNSVERTFLGSLEKVRTKVEKLEVVRRAVADDSGRDAAEMLCRSLLESALLDGVVAFQRMAEWLFSQLPGTTAPPFNAFQRLEQGSALWLSAVGLGYAQWLDPAELRALKVLFERRHLLAHREGLVDSRYLAQTQDGEYSLGQRIVVTSSDVSRLVDSVEKLVMGMQAAVQKRLPGP